MAIAVTTMPARCLSFQLIFTGAETYDDDDTPNVHGGAMWARMPITALVGDTPFENGLSQCLFGRLNLGTVARTLMRCMF